ncbi:MAG: DNA repair protein RecN [Lachnospiraceae bacterium]|nr:DNA repair protein RecN [Lachnospiraceae bacterium]
MLISLNVKNLALIEKEEVYFSRGLNIFSGETGAGKSLLIGSVNLGLGGKAGKDIVRDISKPAEIELVFSLDSEEEKEKLEALDIPFDDEKTVIIKRRIKDGRSVFKVNGESVTLQALKEISSLLIDIHGQHDHQSLLYEKNHMKILDSFAGEECSKAYDMYLTQYNEYKALKEELERQDTDEASRVREADLLRYEIDEIESASLKEGEDEELEQQFHLMNNSRKIAEAIGTVSELIGGDESAGDQVGRAVRSFSEISDFDENTRNLYSELESIDSMISDFRRDIESYLKDIDFSQDDFTSVASRLDVINQLKTKYGKDYDEIVNSLEERKERLEKIENFDIYLEKLKAEISDKEKKMQDNAAKLSKIRSKAANVLGNKLQEALVALNFLDVKFMIDVSPSRAYTVYGGDNVEFMISTNPGEPLRPLKNIASGGELSRVMLALKTVLADTDSIDTLIFDEIDTGISGRTAQKVSESLSKLSKRHQVICITHLPQIAAMADHHFLIAKRVKGEHTVTEIKELENEDITLELARMLGGAEVTDTVLRSASEMKKLADDLKLGD